jgi:hypothetical protein
MEKYGTKRQKANNAYHNIVSVLTFLKMNFMVLSLVLGMPSGTQMFPRLPSNSKIRKLCI